MSYSSIDNNATVTEIDYLSKLYLFTHNNKYKSAAIKGINYIINSQYDNGGWKQCATDTRDDCPYRQNITFNDKAMVNVLLLLKKVATKSYPYNFIDDKLALQSQQAFDKGISCILKTQITINNKKTVWCSQYDKNTLRPAQGRSYEYPSLSGGRESVGILLLLMSIENPSIEIVNAIDAGINWFETSKIENIRLEHYNDQNNSSDYRIVKCTDCPPLWARFYEIDTNKPIFSSKKCHYVYDISKISQNRRNKYEWYSSEGLQVLKEYEVWKNKYNR